MIQGIVDRIEGEYVVAEFTPEKGYALTVDILCDNFDTEVAEGDVIRIYMVNNIDLTENNVCIYKDLQRRDVLKQHLAPLKKKVDCTILVDKKATNERSAEMKDLISSIWK